MEKINHALNLLHISLTEEQLKKFYNFYNLTVEKNKQINLTTIIDFDEFILKHYMDSLSIDLLRNESKEVTECLESSHTKVLDLGTGGGYPGIPLALYYEKSHFTLMDSLQKRIRFLEEAVANLAVANVSPIHGRAEEFARKSEYREQFDLCTSRAVANLSTLCEYALPFVKIGGCFVSYKSGQAQEEIEAAKNAIQVLGGKIISTYNFSLPLDYASIDTFSQNTEEQPTDETVMYRTLIVIKKIKETPKKYPRKAGTPSKDPIY